ncbi:MAG: hypothetical protein OYH77_01715 [Pseudomonadota bacterium]|nr:hypothetical protein [Pseudomonadota bacterium]
MKIFLIIMAMLVAMALVVVGTANAGNVSVLRRTSASVQTLISNLNKSESFVEFSRHVHAIKSSVKRLRSEYDQRIGASLHLGDARGFQLASVEYQQEAVRIKTLLFKELENSEFELDLDSLHILNDVDALLQRVHVID